MADSFSQSPFPEDKWSIPSIIAHHVDIGTYAWSLAPGLLSPTAINAVCLILATPNAVVPYVFDAFISSDTAIPWFLYNINGGVVPQNFAATPLGTENTNAEVLPGWNVGSVPSVRQAIDSGICAANQRVSILNKSWISCPASSGICLATGAVAANVYLSIYWSEWRAR